MSHRRPRPPKALLVDVRTSCEALRGLRDTAKTDANLMAATVGCAKAGVTTGEWAGALREVFGEYRAPTGVSGAVASSGAGSAIAAVREAVKKTGQEMGVRLRFLVGKPGLDGHSNGAEQIAVRARDCGFEVVSQGIRLTASQIVSATVEEDVHVIGRSILSGSHMEAVPAVLKGLREAGIGEVPVVVVAIIPDGDARRLKEQALAGVFTPKDFESRGGSPAGSPGWGASSQRFGWARAAGGVLPAVAPLAYCGV